MREITLKKIVLKQNSAKKIEILYPAKGSVQPSTPLPPFSIKSHDVQLYDKEQTYWRHLTHI